MCCGVTGRSWCGTGWGCDGDGRTGCGVPGGEWARWPPPSFMRRLTLLTGGAGPGPCAGRAVVRPAGAGPQRGAAFGGRGPAAGPAARHRRVGGGGLRRHRHSLQHRAWLVRGHAGGDAAAHPAHRGRGGGGTRAARRGGGAGRRDGHCGDAGDAALPGEAGGARLDLPGADARGDGGAGDAGDRRGEGEPRRGRLRPAGRGGGAAGGARGAAVVLGCRKIPLGIAAGPAWRGRSATRWDALARARDRWAQAG